LQPDLRQTGQDRCCPNLPICNSLLSMNNPNHSELVALDTDFPVWEQFYTVSPLVVIGTRDNDSYDLAPKHMAFPLSWDNYFGFVCTPAHRTYQNILREKCFTVSYPRPDQVVLASLTASPRFEETDEKPVVNALPTFPARHLDGVFLEDGYLFLECELDRIMDGFGRNSLIAGKVIAASVHKDSKLNEEQDAGEMIHQAPLLAYLYPGRFAEIRETRAFPFPREFRK
jgi:flavin reductase (DIM6/NTAB) family NADH-FMN oxidoreductase RutF